MTTVTGQNEREIDTSGRAEIVLVDCLDGQGAIQFRERFTVSDGRRALIIGRSVNADITVDDDHVAPLHASVEVTADGRLLARDLGTVNGVIIDRKRHHADRGLSVPLGADGILQVGRTRLRLRTSHQPLTPEKTDTANPGARSLLEHPGRLALGGALLVATQSGYDAWLGAPRDLTGVLVTSVGFAALLTVAWVSVWALLSRVMQHEWRWLRHAAIFLGISAAAVAVEGLVDLGWFAFSLPPLSGRNYWLITLTLATAITLHLIHASGLTARRAAMIGCLVPAILAAGGYWMLQRSTNRNVNYVEAPLRIYPPGVRLLAAGSSADYFTAARSLRTAADRKMKGTPLEDGEGDE
jgi:pSer/pThr/pTyr-binding forkhead associated (FHA) protein